MANTMSCRKTSDEKIPRLFTHQRAENFSMQAQSVQDTLTQLSQGFGLCIKLVAIADGMSPEPSIKFLYQSGGIRSARSFRGMRSPVGELKAIKRLAQRKLWYVRDADVLTSGADVVLKWFAANGVIGHISQTHFPCVVLHVEELLKLGGIGSGVNAGPDGVG